MKAVLEGLAITVVIAILVWVGLTCRRQTLTATPNGGVVFIDAAGGPLGITNNPRDPDWTNWEAKAQRAISNRVMLLRTNGITSASIWWEHYNWVMRQRTVDHDYLTAHHGLENRPTNLLFVIWNEPVVEKSTNGEYHITFKPK